MVAIALKLPRVGQFNAHEFYDFCEDTFNGLADQAPAIGFRMAHLKTTPCGPSGVPLRVEKVVAEVLARRPSKPA
jgi:hypothetical protein